MKEKTVDFYFAYLSPYAFLANSRIEKILEPLNVSLRYKPIAHQSSSDGPSFSPARYQYIIEEDVPRIAKKYDLKFVPKPPLSESFSASKGMLYAEEKNVGINFNKLVFESRWSFGKDISDPEVLAEIAVQSGLDRNEFVKAINDPLYEQTLLEIKRQAGEAGVFGAPTFIFEGQRFWGNDRIDMLVDAIHSQL